MTTTHPAASGKMSTRVAHSSTNRCRSPRRDTYGHAGSRPPGSRRPGEKRLIHGGTGRRPLLWHPGAVEPPSDRAADQAPRTGPSQRPTAASVMLHRSPHRWRPCPAQASPDRHLTTHMLLVSDGSLSLVHAEFRYRCVDPFAVQLRLSVGPIPGRQLDLHPGAVDRRNQPPPRYRRRPDIPGRKMVCSSNSDQPSTRTPLLGAKRVAAQAGRRQGQHHPPQRPARHRPFPRQPERHQA